MKNIGYTILIIILLAAAAFLVLSPKESEAPEIMPESTEVVEGDMQDQQTEEPHLTPSYRYSLDTERSELEWVAGKKFLVEWIDKGTISFAQGQIQAPENDETFYVDISVDMNTIEVTETGSGGGFDLLEKHLESDDFFDVENHPEARLRTFAGDDQVAEGELTVRGVTAPVTIQISEWNQEEMYVMGSMTVDRLTYGINYNSEGLIGRIENQVINDTFDVNFKIYYTQNY